MGTSQCRARQMDEEETESKGWKVARTLRSQGRSRVGFISPERRS